MKVFYNAKIYANTGRHLYCKNICEHVKGYRVDLFRQAKRVGRIH